MPQIRPITDLRNTTEISDICHAKREPVFITQNGFPSTAAEAVSSVCSRCFCWLLLRKPFSWMMNAYRGSFWIKPSTSES